VLIQNPNSYTVNGTLVFFNAAGQVLHQQPFTILDHGLYTLSAGSVPALVGASGSITVVNDARYGDLAGKSVALEPATGFAFDTPMSFKPR
jgi:energy-converting hydrogenase Eha subunit C